MIRASVSLCTALLTGHLAAQPFLISATRPAVIAGDESDPLARMAMQHLKNYIEAGDRCCAGFRQRPLRSVRTGNQGDSTLPARRIPDPHRAAKRT